MSGEELSFQDDRAYPDNRKEVTMSLNAESKRNKISTKPPYAERHVRWCGRKENESRPENLLCFPTYPIIDVDSCSISLLYHIGTIPCSWIELPQLIPGIYPLKV